MCFPGNWYTVLVSPVLFIFGIVESALTPFTLRFVCVFCQTVYSTRAISHTHDLNMNVDFKGRTLASILNTALRPTLRRVWGVFRWEHMPSPIVMIYHGCICKLPFVWREVGVGVINVARQTCPPVVYKDVTEEIICSFPHVFVHRERMSMFTLFALRHQIMLPTGLICQALEKFSVIPLSIYATCHSQKAQCRYAWTIPL